MKYSLVVLSALSLLFISCLSSTTGDEDLVAEFDFNKAWEAAEPSYGKLILAPDSITIPSYKNVRYVSEKLIIDRGTSLEYSDITYEESPILTFRFFGSDERIWRDSLDYLVVTAKGDTLAFYRDTPNTIYTEFIQFGKPLLARIGVHGNGHNKVYIKSINDEKFNLMDQLIEFYSSVKYLQENYPDSLIPFEVPK